MLKKTKKILVSLKALEGQHQSFVSRIFYTLLKHSWLLAFVIPILYICSSPTYFNEDDNFAQFTPIFHYAYNSILQGNFPWLSPGELNIQLAQSPYYAIFSPILFASFLLTKLFKLEPFWIMNIWAMSNIFILNLILLKFAYELNLPAPLKSAFVICTGIASYMCQFSVNWYYTLPYQILIIWKIYYWYTFFTKRDLSKSNDIVLLITTYLAIYGGNPQLFAYTLLIEALILIPLFNLKSFKLWLRNSIISAILLAPYIYCHLEFWRTSWRTIYNANTIDIYSFLTGGIFNVKQMEGQSIWVILCIALLIFLVFQNKLHPKIPLTPSKKMAVSLAATSVFLLVLSSIDIGSMLGHKLAILTMFTTPRKWWFFGGIISVIAICIWSKYLKKSIQIYLASFSIITALIFIAHNWGHAAWKWANVDYSYVNKSIEILSKYSDGNSRIAQISNFRNYESNPSRNLLLNTWLTGNFRGIVFANGYETIQSKDNHHPENSDYFNQTLPESKSFGSLGISGLWVNAKEHSPSEFPQQDYSLIYQDAFNFFIRLKHPGKIVSCEITDCHAQISFTPKGALVKFSGMVKPELIVVKITPYKNLIISSNGITIEPFICSENWLCFMSIEKYDTYSITYQDKPFIWLLIGSNLLFLTLISAAFKKQWSSN